MAYDINGGSVALVFEENTCLENTTVRCRTNLTLRQFLEVQRFMGMVNAEDIDLTEQCHRDIGDRILLSWDVVQDDVPVPATGEVFATLSMQAINQIIGAWATHMLGTSPNFSAASPNGDTSAAQSEQTVAA